MKLLILSGTPKADGLTYSFVEKAVETAKGLGIDAELISFSKMKLTKCVMCADGWGICFDQHRCAFGDKDGFNELQKKFQEADAYVYITPVYWGEMSEGLKIFMSKLRRCQATKQWNSKITEGSFLKDKPSIIVAAAGGGGGGIVNCFEEIERAISHMSGDNWPRESSGIFDYIAVSRWNKKYKLEAFGEAIKMMQSFMTRPKAVKVTPLSDYKLLLEFDNGEKKEYDFKPHIESGRYRYRELKDVEKFNKAQISGFKVEWWPLVDIDIIDLCD